jgi:hypothetical protein
MLTHANLTQPCRDNTWENAAQEAEETARVAALQAAPEESQVGVGSSRRSPDFFFHLILLEMADQVAPVPLIQLLSSSQSSWKSSARKERGERSWKGLAAGTASKPRRIKL